MDCVQIMEISWIHNNSHLLLLPILEISKLSRGNLSIIEAEVMVEVISAEVTSIITTTAIRILGVVLFVAAIVVAPSAEVPAVVATPRRVTNL